MVRNPVLAAVRKDAGVPFAMVPSALKRELNGDLSAH